MCEMKEGKCWSVSWSGHCKCAEWWPASSRTMPRSWTCSPPADCIFSSKGRLTLVATCRTTVLYHRGLTWSHQSFFQCGRVPCPSFILGPWSPSSGNTLCTACSSSESVGSSYRALDGFHCHHRPVSLCPAHFFQQVVSLAVQRPSPCHYHRTKSDGVWLNIP